MRLTAEQQALGSGSRRRSYVLSYPLWHREGQALTGRIHDRAWNAATRLAMRPLARVPHVGGTLNLTGGRSDGMYDGMAIMTYRTTFSLDQATATRIRALAAQWKVSQAEVIRRVVAHTDVAAKPDPIAMLHALHKSGGGLSAAKATTYLAAVQKDRKTWRGK